MLKYVWYCKAFAELSGADIYEILTLREEVFVLEQQCLYQDIDGLDYDCLHLYASNEELKKIVAYARIIPSGVKSEYVGIGRVVVEKDSRKQGLGELLLENSISYCEQTFPKQSIKISAQAYLEKFYKKFKFETISDIYDEDGIDHIDMVRKFSSP